MQWSGDMRFKGDLQVINGDSKVSKGDAWDDLLFFVI
jgi:hypothetical protein